MNTDPEKARSLLNNTFFFETDLYSEIELRSIKVR